MEGHLKFQGGRGSKVIKFFKEKYEVKGVEGGGSNQKTLVGGVWMFYGTTYNA